LTVDGSAIASAVGTGVISFTIGLVALNQFAPSLITEAFKARWQLERDDISNDRLRDNETFKKSLEAILERSKASFSTLHDARAAVIAELYAKLLEAWRGWERMHSSSIPLEDALRMNDEFWSVYYRSRLYLTSNAIELLSQALQSFQVMGSAAKIGAGKAEEITANAYVRMDDTLRELQQPLEREFRLILGTEDIVSPNVPAR
jgi:hypothetical protein